jgi:class 3 adenylate cyclase
MREPQPELALAPAELESIESFRRVKDTAVLTIMFTDIKGFTQLTDEKGEEHANKVRRLHDDVLERIITAEGAGIIVKHIGDAVMAVFAEPSAAVERALQIHGGLDELNRTHPELEPLAVRIGLDMGQVTLEDAVDLDVFGRHVNRASRVEGLADGGQVLMSYTVFDSARGWLSTPANEHLEWASHGRYHLKGVSGPVEIFEVVDPERAALRAPSGRRARSVPGVAWAAGFVLVGVGATLGYLQFQRTEVFLSDYSPEISYFDGVEEVLLEGEPGDGNRRLVLDVRPGPHVLHYNVADGVRYYAEIEVERGENFIRPDWTESRLPALYRYVPLDDGAVEAEREGDYFYYDDQNQRVERTAVLSFSGEVLPAPSQPDSMVSRLAWRVAVDGRVVSEESREYVTLTGSSERLIEEAELFEDGHHRYGLLIRITRSTAYLELTSAFVPIMP